MSDMVTNQILKCKTMKNNSTQFFLTLFISSLLLLGSSCSEKPISISELEKESIFLDALDSITDSSKLVLELKDIYRAHKIHNLLEEQKDFIAIDSTPFLIAYLESNAKECDSLYNLYSFHDDSLEGLVNRYIYADKSELELRINNLKLSSSAKSDTMNKELMAYNDGVRSDFLNYLNDNYKTERFLSLSADEYWRKIDKKQYIKSSKFEEYKKLNEEDPNQAVEKIFEIIKECDNFQEKTIYGIDLADFYMTGVLDTDTILGEEWAGDHYQVIMDANKYGLYLFEAWVKWRAVTQFRDYGSSKYSIIPNEFYNTWRDRMAYVILKQISTHPEDQMAINQFLLFASHDDIKRFGAYKYGNQNVVEFFELFKN